jgi:hypothetical protein
MMIASQIHDSDSPQVVSIRLFFSLSSGSHERKISRSDSASYAQKRDREVPYGMKGGDI